MSSDQQKVANLMRAAHSGDVASLKKQIEEDGTDIKSTFGPQRMTALHLAAASNEPGAVKYLAEKGGTTLIEATKIDGYTALLTAAEVGAEQCVAALIAAQANVNVSAAGAFSALMSSAQNGHAACVSALLAGGAKANARASDGAHALYMASGHGRVECLNLLLGAGSDINLADSEGSTALYVAAQNHHTDCVRALLAAGARHDIADHCQFTPLLTAAEYSRGRAECIELLLAAGANVDAKCSQRVGSTTAVMFASKQGHANVLRALLKGSSSAGTGNGDDAAASPPKLPNLDVGDINGDTALQMACENGHGAICKLLVDAGCNVNKPNVGGNSPLMFASAGGHIDCVKTLVASGKANINATNQHGESALMQASCKGNAAVVRVLLEAGANKRAKDCDGMTCMEWATENGHGAVVRLLAYNKKKKKLIYIWQQLFLSIWLSFDWKHHNANTN